MAVTSAPVSTLKGNYTHIVNFDFCDPEIAVSFILYGVLNRNTLYRVGLSSSTLWTVLVRHIAAKWPLFWYFLHITSFVGQASQECMWIPTTSSTLLWWFCAWLAVIILIIGFFWLDFCSMASTASGISILSPCNVCFCSWTTLCQTSVLAFSSINSGSICKSSDREASHNSAYFSGLQSYSQWLGYRG